MSALPVISVPATPQPLLTVVAPLPAVDETGEDIVREAEAALASGESEAALAAVDGLHLSRDVRVAFRALLVEASARLELGQLHEALDVLTRARDIAERPGFTAVDLADVHFRLGCCQLALSKVAAASALLSVALDLCDRSPQPCDRLRVEILDRRARCYQRQRDWEAARMDVERALELAEALGDDRLVAQIYFQASLIAERERQWLLARCYAEEALSRCERTGDRLAAHKILNNLGGISFLLGDHEHAVACLTQSFTIALELDSDIGAGYAMSSLAQVQVRSGEPSDAERHARHALELLDGREDHLAEIGNAQLVLGRALTEQDRPDEAQAMLRAADATFTRLGSVSERAAVWMAEGDLAARLGDVDGAAGAYKRAAEALQDFNF